MDQDAEHLGLLSVFHYVVGGLAALCACLPLIHLCIGLVLVLNPHVLGAPGQPQPRFIGWLFVIIASGIILLGWTLAVLVILAGRFLQRRRNYQYCFVIACLMCVFMPFGTVLGVFTLIVLSRPSVKTLFSASVAPN